MDPPIETLQLALDQIGGDLPVGGAALAAGVRAAPEVEAPPACADPAPEAGRIADDQAVGRHVADDHRARADEAGLADLAPAHDDGAGADRRVATDHGPLEAFGPPRQRRPRDRLRDV